MVYLASNTNVSSEKKLWSKIKWYGIAGCLLAWLLPGIGGQRKHLHKSRSEPEDFRYRYLRSLYRYLINRKIRTGMILRRTSIDPYDRQGEKSASSGLWITEITLFALGYQVEESWVGSHSPSILRNDLWKCSSVLSMISL